MNKL
jgi:hypothetical protein